MVALLIRVHQRITAICDPLPIIRCENWWNL